MIGVALYEPEIPPNAGNVARLCAATGSTLHLIGRLGFSFRHPAARRAAMDYWSRVDMRRHVAYAEFVGSVDASRIWMLSTKGESTIWEADFSPGDTLLFGPESRGLPADLLASTPERVLRIPMVPGIRSLNLGTSVGVTLYEALRRVGWKPPKVPGPDEKT